MASTSTIENGPQAMRTGDEELETQTTSQQSNPFEGFVRKIASFKNASVVRAGVKSIKKMLTAIIKKPADMRYRKMKVDNIIVKKYIVGLPGAEELFETLGYVRVEEAGHTFLFLADDRVNPASLAAANSALDKTQQFTEEVKAAPKPMARTVRCSCGFWGDPEQENMCSVCYRKKYIGGDSKSSSAPSNSGPKPCTKGCGFFGSPKFDGMCSQCAAQVGVFPPRPKTWRQRFRSAMVKLKAVKRLQDGTRIQQEDIGRCWKCRKRLGLSGIACRCRYIFCGQHRYPDEHECVYDHKKRQRRRLQSELRRIEAAKFEKISE